MPSIGGAMRGTSSGPTSVARRSISAFDRQSPLIWLTLGGLLLIATILASTAFAVLNFRERALNNSERELENNVLLLARHFDRELHDFEAVQRDVVRRMELLEISSPDSFRRKMSGQRDSYKFGSSGRRFVRRRWYQRVRHDRITD